MMPLYAMNFEDGAPKGNPLYEFLELHGEMPGEDFLGEDLKNVYESNFTSPLYDSHAESLSKLKRELAESLNANMQGPYFVHDKSTNNQTILRFVILNPYDLQWFSDRWGHEFKIDAASADKNIMSHFNRVCQWEQAKDLRLTKIFDELSYKLAIMPVMAAEKLPGYLRDNMPGAFA
jgi:hypothetical protein